MSYVRIKLKSQKLKKTSGKPFQILLLGFVNGIRTHDLCDAGTVLSTN